MEILSVLKFGKLCEEISPVSFVFDLGNQEVDDTLQGLCIVSEYSEVLYALSPNQICFKNDYGFLCLQDVREVHYMNENKSIGHVFKILCRDRLGSREDVSYTIIANKKNS